MSVGLQPSSLVAGHLRIERQDGLTLFTCTSAAQERLDDLFNRHKDLGLTASEQEELDALAELDRIFTDINSQLVLAHGDVPKR